MPYADVFHVLVPTDASAIDPLFQLPLDSVILTEVILTDTVTLEQYTLADIGLEIVCNNLGSSPDPCTLIAGAQYCASLEGTPTAGGVFQMSLDVAAWVTVFGLGVAQPYSFAGTFWMSSASPSTRLETCKPTIGPFTPILQMMF